MVMKAPIDVSPDWMRSEDTTRILVMSGLLRAF
jgi:hypothetical protein